MSFIPLVRFLAQSGLIQELAARLRSQRRADLEGAGRIPKGLIASALAQQESRSLLVVTATLEEAGRWTAQLEGMGWESVQLYPTSEASPYEPFDLEPELVWGQFQVLADCLQGKTGLAIVATERALQPHLPPPRGVAGLLSQAGTWPGDVSPATGAAVDPSGLPAGEFGGK